MDSNSRLLSDLFEAGERLGVSYWQLYRGIEAGLVKGVRLGGRLLIAETEIAHLAEHGFGAGKRTRKRQARAHEEAEVGAVAASK